MSYPPSMVHKSGNKLVVRSVVSGDKLYGTSETEDDISGVGDATTATATTKTTTRNFNCVGGDGFNNVQSRNHAAVAVDFVDQDDELPQCKVKRNYACSSCSYYTQNPRYYLHHLKNVHKEKIRIYECPHCLYASKHSQKLQRHIHMVHVMGKRKMLIKAKTSTTTTAPTTKKKIASSPVVVNKKEEITVAVAAVPATPSSSSSSSPPPPPLPQLPTAETNVVEPVAKIENLKTETTTPITVFETEEVNEADSHERPLKCSLCSFSSRNPNLVTRHERLVHLKKKFYRCTKCDYITHMKARFTKHVKYHSMPMIKCEMCDFRTPYKWNLDRHNKNHFANGAFKCSQCNFTADIKQSLTVHEMNHHVPPVNQNGPGGLTISTPAKRRCRVGASDIVCRQESSPSTVDPDFDDMELLRMERESLPPPVTSAADGSSTSAVISDEADQMAAVEITMVKSNANNGCKNLNLKNPTAAAYLNGTLKPEDVILTKNGSVYVKKFKCRVCHYKAAWESEMIRHEVRVHGLDTSAKKKPLPRPIPNLIPIQNNNGNNSSANSSPPVNHKSKSSATKKVHGDASAIKNGLLSGQNSHQPYSDFEFEKPMTEKDLNDICAKSCATSSLKDFASLIGAEETFKNERLKDFAAKISDNDNGPGKLRRLTPDKTNANDAKCTAKPDVCDNESNSNSAEVSKKLPESFKKKNATFFDRLKEKLMVGAGENNNLVCWCGHKSKCLSESILHQKQHSENVNEKNEKTVVNSPMISGAELSSTRCQHCRQRCKSSSDLFVHLQSCPEMVKKETDSNCNNTSQANEANVTQTKENKNDGQMDVDGEMEDEPEPEENEEDFFQHNEPVDKEENKVFVWNNFPEDKEECDEYADEENRSKSPASESSSLVGYEIAPGIGSVLPNTNDDNTDQFRFTTSLNIDVNNAEATTKKVFKCPQCTFWASTASRFHVHMVSHLNVKPFGCSVCSYQSKWKWDVTKHIRLKKERDPVHERAEIRTIDMETGRRNYTKYNRFLTCMRVHEPRMDSVSPPKPLSPKMPVPILPKLTPAPSMDGDSENRATVSSDMPMRPLPLLHPANPTVALKRPHDGGDDSDIPKKKVPSEKKMWKCKKCKFRNTDRNVVLAHVKEHYTNGGQNSNESNVAANGDSELYNAYNREFRNKMESQEIRNEISQATTVSDESNSQLKTKSNFRCDICNFVTDCSSTFRFHNRHHVENPQALYKCCFCPFFANDKQFMLNHVSAHGVRNVEESLPLLVNNGTTLSKQTENINENATDEGDDGCDFNEMNANDFANSGTGEETEVYKRFKCSNCPYVTNNKSQYLYHKQFHRLRGAPFKCNICTYNVTKRHLLHQHLKIHGVKRSQFKNCIYDAVEKESGFSLDTNIDTAQLPDIPMVWVHKGGTLTKMFKCRHCPHVNLRKSNIHEHEKMHFDRLQRSPNGSITNNQVSVHRCTECNYVCNNAGALASHFKVHQGAFGQICALADPQRSDESQIKEITRLLKDDDRFKKDSSMNQQSAEESKNNQKIMAAPTVEAPSATAIKTADSCSENTNATMTRTTAGSEPTTAAADEKKNLHFCNVCPARFLCMKDYESHVRFHSAHNAFKCNSCTYSASQQAQLMAHRRVHTNEYQEKTNMMNVTYEVSKECPRPKTTLILDKPGFAGLGWVVVHSSSSTPKKTEDGYATKPKVVTKQFSCHKCPARFFKSVALQHHLTLHGGKDPYQCRSCDYRVKTYGNLIKHEAVHGLEPRNKIKNVKSKKPAVITSIPCSGTELFQHRTEQLLKERTGRPATASSVPLQVDPEFGILMHGSPEFIYPTTLKNGKMKDKRYKCHKCPSAFEKREQYKIHLPLHGAKFRYKCEKCDYSVKYFANYAQHKRKHDDNERSLSERSRATAGLISKASEESGHDVVATDAALSRSPSVTMNGSAAVGCVGSGGGYSDDGFYSPEKSSFSPPSNAATPTKAAKTLHISVADQQAVVLMQEKITDNNVVNLADQLHRCYYCPYSHPRKDAVENHERCHFNTKGSYICEFCNYTVPQPHFLREHQKLHFGNMKGITAEAYMKCDRLEIWMKTEEGNILIFKDNGGKTDDQFEPAAQINEDESEYKKMYVDVKTGEEYTPEPIVKEEELSIVKEELTVDIKCEPKSDDISEPFLPGVQLPESSSSSSASSSSSSSSSSTSSSSSASCFSASPDRIKEDYVEEDMYDVKKEPFVDDINEGAKEDAAVFNMKTESLAANETKKGALIEDEDREIVVGDENIEENNAATNSLVEIKYETAEAILIDDSGDELDLDDIPSLHSTSPVYESDAEFDYADADTDVDPVESGDDLEAGKEFERVNGVAENDRTADRMKEEIDDSNVVKTASVVSDRVAEISDSNAIKTASANDRSDTEDSDSSSTSSLCSLSSCFSSVSSNATSCDEDQREENTKEPSCHK